MNKLLAKLNLLGIKSLSDWIIMIISFAAVFMFVEGRHAPYEETALTLEMTWFLLFPILIGTLYYLFYFKKQSIITRLFDTEAVKIPPMLMALMIALVVTATSKFILAGVAKFLATEPATKLVNVNNIQCHKSFRNRYSYMSLSATQADDRILVLSYPYRICENHPEIHYLKGHTVQLSGYKWPFGTIYPKIIFNNKDYG